MLRSTASESPILPLMLLLLLSLFASPISAELSLRSCNLSRNDITAFSRQTEAMFEHAYTSYATHAFPADELKPLSCTPDYSFAGIALTLVDTLDTFIVMRQWSRFADAVRNVSTSLTFQIDNTVSVFETTIRVLGGLLSAHGLLTEGADDTGFEKDIWLPEYDGKLLVLATDLADRLMPAFNTPTGIPFGAINLAYGVEKSESRIASTAGAGSLILEFGTLSRYVGDPKYYNAALNAMRALHKRASRAGLVGNHIDIDTGDWVAPEAGVGGLVDSFYEYMWKGYILFGDERLLAMFRESYAAIKTYLHKRPWYLDADMWSGHTSSLASSSLAAFWPGVQVTFGDHEDAADTARAHYSVWRRYGCLPEGYHVVDQKPMQGMINYPLRPELAESIFYLHWATNDTSWVGAAGAMMHSIEELTKVKCGYAAVKDTSTHVLEDLMPSFLLSETLKYLYLVFNAQDADGKLHWSRSGKYVFTTEAHPLRIETEDIRHILGLSLEKAAYQMPRTSSGHATAEGASATKKCRRRPKTEQKLPCGYNMPGTDFPQTNADALMDPASNLGITPVISKSVLAQIRTRDARGEGVRVGDVLFGERWACRIVQIEGHVVSYERLHAMDVAWEREREKRERERRNEEGAVNRAMPGLREKCRRFSFFETVQKTALV
ncbi:mannosyl-oligosaccharide--1,2-mannosidase [Chondrus crispus]|uniref:alpha-1,2-Mannosidase n=1 Tax=Chondrus crispus TaxID=2769 RepID=R7QJM8_CHOCR|nr:mannosyl-oligosaccharide--1,2-mannosidase [Chondrus crispus]CDF38722.1 mannosyl-oligosaccharide--1,2-mannosidase [Chondrus crispus]|eukprot:XP_005718627.1 mannosyl-oligosaccharide--1,2-mannosidase [Chondrus crispus]